MPDNPKIPQQPKPEISKIPPRQSDPALADYAQKSHTPKTETRK